MIAPKSKDNHEFTMNLRIVRAGCAADFVTQPCQFFLGFEEFDTVAFQLNGALSSLLSELFFELLDPAFIYSIYDLA